MAKINLEAGTKLFVSENLNRYFQKLGWQCRQLLRRNLIFSYKYQNESYIIKYKVKENEKQKKITNEDQLFDLFPEFFEEN